MAKASTKKPATKKPAAKKPAVKKAAPKKKVAAKKPAVKKAAPKKKVAAKKPAVKKAAPKKAKVKRTPNAAFMKPMTIGSALQPIVGTKALPRTEITKKLWQYIKKNGLQDAKVRTNINADENLKAVFGGKKTVNMFEMTRLVNKHIS